MRRCADFDTVDVMLTAVGTVVVSVVAMGPPLEPPVTPRAPAAAPATPAGEAADDLADRLAPHYMRELTVELSTGDELHGAFVRIDRVRGTLTIMDAALDDVVIEVALIERVVVREDRDKPIERPAPAPNELPPGYEVSETGEIVDHRSRLTIMLDEEDRLYALRVDRALIGTGAASMGVGLAMVPLGGLAWLGQSLSDPDGVHSGPYVMAGGAVLFAAGTCMLAVGVHRYKRHRNPSPVLVGAWARPRGAAGLSLSGRF